jgi:hypothetical protein
VNVEKDRVNRKFFLFSITIFVAVLALVLIASELLLLIRRTSHSALSRQKFPQLFPQARAQTLKVFSS